MADNSQSERARYRIVFGKRDALRYTSHLDLARIWERALRRARVPLIYSQGFNPRPQLQLAAALPLGYASTCELLDIWLDGDIPPADMVFESLRLTLPEGLTVVSVEPVELHEPALQTRTHSASYEVQSDEDIDASELARQVAALLAQVEIPRERRGKPYDLRPLIISLSAADGDQLVLRMELLLSAKEGSGRPDEVLDALGLDPLAARVTRVAIWLDPLPA